MIETVLRDQYGVYEAVTRAICDICRKGIKWGPSKVSIVSKGVRVRAYEWMVGN